MTVQYDRVCACIWCYCRACACIYRVCALFTVRLPCDQVYYRTCTYDMYSYPKYFDKYVVNSGDNSPLSGGDLPVLLLRLWPWSGFHLPRLQERAGGGFL